MFVLLQDRRFPKSERQHMEKIIREIRNVNVYLKHMAMGFAEVQSFTRSRRT